jgi:hypothetical protein
MPPREKTADAVKLMLRLPRSLHERLQQQAKRNNVSLNTEIVNELERHEEGVLKATAEALQPMVRAASSGVALYTAELMVSILKPEALEQFKEDTAKAGLPRLSPKIPDDMVEEAPETKHKRAPKK